MAQTKALIDTLKQALKNQHMTYAEVAQKLDMSEANVKRMFASRRFTLERLEDVCQLIQLELSDLFQLYEESRQRITTLSKEQEKELVSDTRLLLVAVSVRNRLCFDDIVNNYNFSPAECVRYLAKLDKLKIIDLLPNNRIKLRIDEHFHWLRNGPIERFYEKQIQNQFLKATFNGELEERMFLFGLLGDSSAQIIINKMKALAKELAELHRQDVNLPLGKRHNIGLMMALRPWDLDAFVPLHRK